MYNDELISSFTANLAIRNTNNTLCNTKVAILAEVLLSYEYDKQARAFAPE